VKTCAYKNCGKQNTRKLSIYCSDKCKNGGAVTKRRHALKQKAVGLLGGKCKKCGYNKCTRALQFHHKNPNKKDFGLSSKGITRSWGKIKKELSKCVLLCANCHAEEHASIAE